MRQMQGESPPGKGQEESAEGEITLIWGEGGVPSCFLIFKKGVDNAVHFLSTF